MSTRPLRTLVFTAVAAIYFATVHAASVAQHGEYRYEGGWNVNALVATGIGSVFSTILPNFTNLLPPWWNTYGWFFGVAIGGAVYYVMAMARPRAMPRARVAA